MLHKRIQVPTSSGASIQMDAFVPSVTWKIDLNIKRPAIVICPGGGYRFCNLAEAEPVALRFLSEGFNVFIVWYRVSKTPAPLPRGYETVDWYAASEKHRFPMPLQDLAACVAHVRASASEWHTDPNRIAVMGFSAGGYLAASLGGLWTHEDLWRGMRLSPQQVRPNAVALCYAVIAGDHDGLPIVFERLTGSADPADHQRISALNWISPSYPPTFIWQTFPDELVKVHNSIRLAKALKAEGVLTEVHVYHKGRHGLTLCSDLTGTKTPECESWPEMAARFLKRAMPAETE